MTFILTSCVFSLFLHNNDILRPSRPTWLIHRTRWTIWKRSWHRFTSIRFRSFYWLSMPIWTYWKLYTIILSVKLALLLHVSNIRIIHHVIYAKIWRWKHLCNVKLNFIVVVWVYLILWWHLWFSTSWILNVLDGLRNCHAINVFLGDADGAVALVAFFNDGNLFTFYFRFGRRSWILTKHSAFVFVEAFFHAR